MYRDHRSSKSRNLQNSVLNITLCFSSHVNHPIPSTRTSISVSCKPIYEYNWSLAVVLESTAAAPSYRGFLIQARLVADDTTVVGQFEEPPPGGEYRYGSCANREVASTLEYIHSLFVILLKSLVPHTLIVFFELGTIILFNKIAGFSDTHYQKWKIHTSYTMEGTFKWYWNYSLRVSSIKW